MIQKFVDRFMAKREDLRANFVSYGSCSGCDTLEAIRDYSGDTPTEKQLDEYMTLALHVVQGLRQISGYDQ